MSALVPLYSRGVNLRPWGKWQAQIQHQKRNHYLGLFDTKEEAMAARRAAEIRLRGEFAPAEVA